MISVGLALIAALLLPVVWRVSREEENTPVEARGLTDVTLRWRCSEGHRFSAAGQIEPRRCWECDRPAFAVAQYRCPSHGEHEAMVRFELNEEGDPHVARAKLPGDEWAPVDLLSCPRCRKPLRYMREDPLSRPHRRTLP